MEDSKSHTPYIRRVINMIWTTTGQYLSSVFAKMLEMVMYNRLISFFHKNNIFTEAQNGLRKGKCIETAIQALIESVQEAVDKKIYSIGIFIHLLKAYDVLNHELLLKKTIKLWCKGHHQLMVSVVPNK
jgi:hypothetical protein